MAIPDFGITVTFTAPRGPVDQIVHRPQHAGGVHRDPGPGGSEQDLSCGAFQKLRAERLIALRLYESVNMSWTIRMTVHLLQ